MKKQVQLHIIDPHLSGVSGHGFSFISALLNAARGTDCCITIWVAENFNADFNAPDGLNVVFNKYFRAKGCKMQSFVLIRRLLKGDGRIFFVTGTKRELLLLSLATIRKITQKKCYLYFHWLRLHPVKNILLKLISHHQPHLETLAPTNKVLDALLCCGFSNARRVPYPITQLNFPRGNVVGFRWLLYAGTVRMDKGFGVIVDVLSDMKMNGMNIPVCLPCINAFDDTVEQDIKDLCKSVTEIDYRYLIKSSLVLDEQQYIDQFEGSICLQLYDTHLFEDRISGVTLDALSVGCPILCTAGTWTARVVEKYGAGIVVQQVGVNTVLQAVHKIIDDYASFAEKAMLAGNAMQQESNALHLLNVLME